MIFPPVRPGLLCALLLSASTTSKAADADWPQWRGPARDGHAASGLMVPKTPNDLRTSWRKNIGGGFSSPVASGGKLVYLDEQAGKEVAHCIDAGTGEELWRREYATAYEDEWGAGPRSTPSIEGDRVYLQSCDGEFECLKMAKGELVWKLNFDRDFGVKFLGSKAREGTASRRGNNGSPLIDGEAVIIPIGSPDGASLGCFDKLTGKKLWTSGSDEAAYSSPIVGTFSGVRQVVAFTADALLGADRANGNILWRVPLKTNAKRHAATPVLFEENVIVNSHTIGLVSFHIAKEGSAFRAVQSWANRDLKINLSTPVLVNGWLYCQGPSKNYVCVNARTGELAWSQAGFGKENTSTIAAGNTLIALADDGQLVFMEANPERCVELARLQLVGKNWNHPAFASGKLFLRDYRQLISLEPGK